MIILSRVENTLKADLLYLFVIYKSSCETKLLTFVLQDHVTGSMTAQGACPGIEGMSRVSWRNVWWGGRKVILRYAIVY